MGTDGDPPAEKKRKFPWKKPYAKMSLQEVEERIGVSMIHLGSSVIAPKDMLVAAGYKFEEVSDVITTAKNEVYKQIERYIAVEVPSLDLSNFMEPNVNELVYSIISPIIYEFRHKTGREDVKLFREKPIISTDLETGGFEEFVVVSVTEHKYVFIVVESLGAGMGRCLLSMKDMSGNNNNGGVVYGFVTTGDSWRMLSYDGVLFRVTEKVHVMFETMAEDRERWMRDYSLLVDCVYAALSHGGKDYYW